MTQKPRPLRRREVPEYLLKNHGITRTSNTLAKLAVTGGGPPMIYDGRIPLYPVDELDAWARSILSPLVGSTAERKVTTGEGMSETARNSTT